MIRILHAADLHLDSPFEGLPEEKAALRRNEQRQLLRALAQLRAESGAQLVLLAGDLFDSAASWAGTEDTLRLALAEMEVPVFISPGNHDFYSRSGRWQRLALPENVRDKRLLLIDDIVTTGSTLTECVRVLREAGAADVVCLTLARTEEEH